jgi:hypothetical protein
MASSSEFPGVDLGMLAVDLAGTLSRYDYPIDICDADIEPNLPGFLRACLATAKGTEPPVSAPARTVQVKVKDTYGQYRVYPASPDAFRFAKIAGTKTFAPQDLAAIRELGYEITIAAESPRLPGGFGDATVI